MSVFAPEEINRVTAPETAAPEAPAAEAEVEPAPASEEEPEDTDDGQLLFGSAAEKFKDIDLKFGIDYDIDKE